MSEQTKKIREALEYVKMRWYTHDGQVLEIDTVIDALAALSELEAQPSQTDEQLYKQAMDDVTPEALSRMDKRLAAIDTQTEDLEAQAGELSDGEMERITTAVEQAFEVRSGHCGPWDNHVFAEECLKLAASLGYLKPSQAIGEQAPVAQANPIIGNVHERWHELGYGNTDRLHERFRGDPWRIFYAGWIEGRAPLVAQLKDNHRLFTEARDALAEYRDKHPSIVSPEARDRAIELVRAFVEVTRPADGLWLDTSHRNPIGLRFDADQYDELRDLHRQALSALRGS